MSKWHKGAPPSIGWWPASVVKDITAIRWWNGQYWSLSARPKFTASRAAAAARHRTYASVDVEWTDRPKSWPARSRT